MGQLAAENSGTIGIAIRRWRRPAEAADFGLPQLLFEFRSPKSLTEFLLRQPPTGRHVLLFKHRKIDPIASLAGLCPSYEFRLADEVPKAKSKKARLRIMPAPAADKAAPWPAGGRCFSPSMCSPPAARDICLPAVADRGGSYSFRAGGLFGRRGRAFSMGTMVSTTSAPTTTLTRSCRLQLA
jgi:hypothetical protein